MQEAETEEWRGGRRKGINNQFHFGVFSARPHVKFSYREKGGAICSCRMKLRQCWCSGKRKECAAVLGDAERCWCQIYFNEICPRDRLTCFCQ